MELHRVVTWLTLCEAERQDKYCGSDVNPRDEHVYESNILLC